MADVPSFATADLAAELDWPGGIVRHLEETDREPDREDVAARRQVVENLRQQLIALIGMIAGRRVGRLETIAAFRRPRRKQQGPLDAAALRVLWIAGGTAGRRAEEGAIVLVRAAAGEQVRRPHRHQTPVDRLRMIGIIDARTRQLGEGEDKYRWRRSCSRFADRTRQEAFPDPK